MTEKRPVLPSGTLSWRQPGRIAILAGSLVVMMSLGLNYGWSIFVRPLELEYGWRRAETAVIFTVSIITFTLGTLLSGQMMRRLRARSVVQCAAVLFLAGFALSARTTTLPQLILSYGVLCGLGVGVAYNTIIATVLPWFPERRGTVSGLMLMFYGSGTFVLGSLTTLMLNSPLGWRRTMTVLAFIFFAINFAGSFLMVPATPSAASAGEAGSQRAGAGTAGTAGSSGSAAATRPSGGTAAPGVSPAPAPRPDPAVSPRAMLRQPAFWLFFLWLTLNGGSGMTIFAHAAPGASDLGADPMVTALLLGLLSIASGAGRFLAGTLHDRRGLRFALLLVSGGYLAGAVCLQLAARLGNVALLGAGYLFCGFCFGGVTSLVPVFTGSVFGQRWFHINFSYMLSYSIFSVTIGSSVGGLLRDWTGSYTLSYGMIFAYVTAGIGISFLLFRTLRAKG